MGNNNLDLKSQAYALKVQEGKLNCEPCGSKGSLDNNINETLNSCSNMCNFLKTHNMCSKDNLSVLKTVVSQVGSQASSSHQVAPAIKKRAEYTQKTIFDMKSEKIAA